MDGSGSASGYYTTTSFSGIALGEGTDIKESGTSRSYSGVAFGNYARATGGLSLAFGNYAQATNASSMAIGTATLSSGFNSLAMMRQSAATKDFSTAIGTAAWADGVGSFAMGYSATAKGEQSIAIGAAETKKLAGDGKTPSAEYNGDGNTVTEGARSLAFGTTARTSSAASDSMAFGSKANTSGANAVAMGYNAQAKATDAFAIGNTAVSTGTGATAMGKSAQATGNSSFAMGSGSSASGTDAIAMGSSSLAKMANSIALGGNAKSQGADALAIGGAANAGNTGAIALGKGAQAVSANSTAIGSGATVTGANAMAIGTNAKASTPNSLALGSGTEITKTLTDGYSAFTNEINHNYVMGVVAVGNDGVGRRITNVAGGEDDTDAANIKQLKYVNSNLAKSIAGSSYTGYEANGSTYKAPDFNIKNSTYHTVKEAVEAAQTNFFSAKGDSSDANYDNTGATGTNATAAGVRTSAAGNYGTAVGADASAANANSTAIGYKAKSSVNDGVALGSDSVASVAAGKTGYNVGTANSRTNTYSGLTGAALTSALGAVSVGDGGTKTRQITNVAAGTADTDAVNVAQLRNVNLKVAGNTNANGGKNDVLLDNQTLTVKGDGTYITTTANNQTIDVALTDATKKKIDNAADKDLSNITDTAKKNITALGTVVQAGNNVTVGAPAADPVTGQKTYTVNGMDTKVSLGTSGLMTLSGGTPDASGVRNYIVDVDPAKVAKTDLSNITDGGRTVIREEAKNSVKVIAGKNTVITEGVDGTYKTYKVDVDAPDYQLVENSGAADKAYTVSGNKVDLTVQDAKNPADKKTVTIKDIASKTELDKVQDRSVKYDGAAGKDTVTLEGVGGTKITNLKDGLIASGSKEAVNGGQLHDVKNELNTAITNTKNEVIGKGLRFDADNNSEKTNKLGSKVAVNGDSNITTEITQSGDDTKIGIKLNQDLNVKTVTAVDTVKAGGVTVGRQADGTNPTVGNYVTGLDNKNWDASNIVSGRAATEDQLQKALNKQSADATDYRLIRNQATDSNGDYTVDGNGDVALTVQDKNHTDKTETVTIKDVASKSAMDKGLNFAGDTGTASNRKLGETVTVKGGATGTLSDGNIGVVSDGNGTLNVKLAKTLTGLDSVTAGGTTINSSGLTVGGKTYVSSNGIDANSQKITNVADGNVTAGSKEAVNGGQLHQVKQDLGNQITNTTNTINNKIDTTKQDLIDKGLQFDADNHDAKTNKLGSKITVSGDGTNISTAVTQSGDDTTIKVALGQDINVNTVTAIKTVKAGTAVMGNQSVTDNKAAAQAGNFVTGLDNKSWTISDPAYVSGRAATEDQLKTVSDAVKAANASATDYRLIGDPNNAVDGSYKVDNNRVDLKVKDDKTGTVNTVTIKDIASKTELDKVQDRSVKYDGTAGKDTVTLEGVNGTKITNLQDGNVASGSKDAVNGGQLHDAKNELNTNINNAKTELTNTGLRFDADNNSEKTNKLGSKVTVNGDNNITTNITQTGDDTKIGVTLNKDLNVTTLTAADTVKAGTVTMGKQTDGANPANTGNYVTGLANKDWSVTNPTAVSGRAATEDQLKTVTEAVKTQGANATDFRLVKNAAAADGAYTVDSNGDVALTVQDKNHTDKTETVTIKDVASKANVDKLNDRAVKYDADNSGNVDKTKVTYEGPAYANKTGGTHVTNVAYATGNDGSEAVNVDYLKDRIKDSETTVTDKGLKFDANNGGEKTNKLGSKVTVKGDNANIITEIAQDGNGDSTIDVKLGKDLKTETITATGANGKDGKIGINGKDGVTTNISVTRDGQPGVDGAAGITTTRIVYQKPDGTNEEVATLNDGLKFKGDMGATSNVKLNKQVDITGGVTSASDLATGNNIGVTSAAVDADGNAKLQLQLAKNLTGLQSVTASDTVKAGTAAMGNQSVTDNKSATQAGNFVTGLDNKTWTMSDPAYVSGRAATEDQLKTVSDAVKAANASATDYRLVENANAADKAYTADASGNIKLTVEDKNHAGQTETVTIKDVASKSAMDKGLNFDGDSGTTINKKLGDTIAVKGGADTSKLADGNIGVVSDGNGTLNVKLAKTLAGLDSVTAGGTTIDSNGLTVGGKTYVSSNGIDANSQKITNVADGNVAAGSKEAVNGGQLHQVKQDLGNQITDTTNTINNKIDATKQDLINTGLKFDANVGGEQTNKLGSKVTVKGEGAAADTDYSGENIKTFITQDASGNTTIDVKMNKNVVADTIKVNKNGKDGKDGVSITGPAGVAGQDGNNGKVGITGADGKDAVSMSGKDGVGHIGLTGPAGTNGVNGTNGIDISVKNGYDDAGKGVKGEKGVDGADGITRIVYQDKNGEHQVATMEDGLQFTGNNTGTVNKQKLNSLVKIQGEGVTEIASGTFTSASGNINVKANGTDTLELQLAKDLKNLDSVTATKTVKAGDVTVGKQIDGANPANTGNYVTGLDNRDWNVDTSTPVNGRAATEDQLRKISDAIKTQGSVATDFRLVKNAAAADGSYTVDSNGDVELTVEDKNHTDKKETVTIKDVASKSVVDKGLNFDGDSGTTINKKLGDTVAVKGGADTTQLADNNIGVVSDGNGTLNVKLAKTLTGLDSVTAGGTTIDSNGLTVGGKTYVSSNGIDANSQKITNVADGNVAAGSKEAVNGGQLHDAKNELNTAITNTKNEVIGKGLRFDADNSSEKTNKLGSKVAVNGDSNITTEITQSGDDTKIGIKLNQDLNVKTVTAVDTVKAGGVTVGRQADGTNPTIGNYVTGLDNKNWDASNIVSGRAATEDQLQKALNKQSADATDYRLIRNQATGSNGDYTVDGNGDVTLTVQDKNHTDKTESVTIKDVASKSAMDKGLNFDGDSGTTINKKLGDTVAVKGGADTSKLADGNIGVVSDGNGTLNVKLAKTLAGLDSVTAGGTTMDSNGLTVGGKTYVSSNGIDANSQKITNVADGNVAAGSKEAVNGGQLHQVKQDLGDQITDTTNTINNKIDATKQDLINTGLKFDANVGGEQTNKLGSKVTVKGEGAAADTDYSGENIKTFITQDASGNTTIDVKMNKNVVADTIKVNKNGKDGKDGVSITGPAGVAGQDGNNGKVGITGADGKDAVSMSGKDGVGHIGLTGPAGTNGVNGTNGIDISVKNGYDDAATGVKGEKGVDGVDGITRIVYQDKNGEHQVATMEDGLQFTGNNIGTVNKQKLNSLVKIQGEGVTETASGTFTSASGNINVKANGTDTLELQLAKDLKNLDSVTATKTVKAGTVTMGDQTVTNTKGTAETGNYVTGLDNTDWAADKIVSGRAATEDQLKKALDKQSADATDYRLIRNQATGSNGDYTVDGNGDVALTVQDKNHTDKTETVTIKDVASKSAVDKLTDRAVKYALDGSDSPDKTKVAYEGPAYTNKTGGTHVTNVAYAAGTDGSEAVNVDYLNDKIKANADTLTDTGLKFDANVGGEQTNKLGSKVTVKGEGNAADTDYSGENIKTFITQDASGNTTIDVKMNKNVVADTIKVNKNGKDGKDGVSITGPAGVAGQDGNNGKVGITGADGKDAVSMSGKDGVGHIGLTGPAGTNGMNGTNGIDISVKNGYDDAGKGVKGEKGVDGADGITRIVYQDKNGEHQVATMDDGMLYGGDGGTVIKKKLNNQVNIKGGISDESKLSTDANIGVMSDGTDTLMLRLAKDLKGLNSATFNNGTNGTTVVNGGGMSINDAAGNLLTSVTKDGVTITNGPSMTTGGIDAANKQITNVADGKVETGSKDAVNGGQLADQIESVTKSITEKGFGLTAEDGKSVKKPLGETVTVKGDGTNIKTSVDNGTVKVELKKDINVDTVTANKVTTGNTTMDTNGVTVKDGANEAAKLTKDGLQINDGGNKAVTVNKDGLTIENGPKVTKDGIDAADKKITNVADGTVGAGSKDAVNGGQLHTAIEDIKSAGFGLTAEDGQSVKKPLGSTIDLKGDGNIKTSVDGDAVKISLNDKLTIGQDPAKQIKVDGATGSVTAGDGPKQVKMDGAAGTITAGSGANRVKVDGNDGSVTANTVKAGDVVAGRQSSGGQTGNFVTGLDNKTWNPDNPAAVTGRAATEDQLKAVNDDFNNKAKTGRVFQGDQSGDDGKVVRGLGDTMNLTGGADVNRLTDNNIGVVKNSAGDGYNIKLAKDINMGDGSTSYTKAVAGTNTTVPYTVQTKVDGQGVTITPSVNGRPVSNHTVSLTENGLNNGNNTITNVAPGVNGTDAVNVNQLSSVMRNMDGKVADVGAASAAISGLKPLQYDPLEPTQVLAAVGHYKGSTAAAVGLAHYTNESTMFHMGVSIGGHDNMVNAGVSYKFGTSDAKKAVPERYKGGPISSMYVMQDEMAALKAENERMKKHDEELTAKYDQVQRDNEEMKAQIALLMQKAGIKK